MREMLKKSLKINIIEMRSFLLLYLHSRILAPSFFFLFWVVTLYDFLFTSLHDKISTPRRVLVCFKSITNQLIYVLITLACYLMFYSILSHSIGRSPGHHRCICYNPFHLVLFSAALRLVELTKSIPVHSLILSSHLFFWLPLLIFPFTVPCRIGFAKPKDLETWTIKRLAQRSKQP